MAYTVAIERYTASADGAPAAPTELRATHVYRREDGHWRAVHRHADRRPADQVQDLNEVIEAFREALRSYVKGDPEPAISFLLRPGRRNTGEPARTATPGTRRRP
jgi:hypothetical protein